MSKFVGLLIVLAFTMQASAYWIDNPDPCVPNLGMPVPNTGVTMDSTPSSTAYGSTFSVTVADAQASATNWANGGSTDVNGDVNSGSGDDGGIVWKFVNTTPVAMEIDLSNSFSTGWWSGMKGTLYYSDTNDWSSLDVCNGSNWGGWGNTWEDNPLWKQVDSWSNWGEAGLVTISGEKLYSSDGTFYVRCDYTNCNGIASPYFNVLQVDGRVPEPVTMSLLLGGGLLALRRRRS